MSLRPGGLDPGLLFYLERTEQLSSQEFASLVNSPEPMTGFGGPAQGATPAERVAIFCSQVQKWVGA
jgi:acetate kinase